MSTCQKEVRGYPRRKQAVGTQAIHYIGRLYKVESDAGEAGLTVEERKEKRIRETYPLILEFEKWLQDAYLRVLPKSRMGKAIEYTYALLLRLSRYAAEDAAVIYSLMGCCKAADVDFKQWMNYFLNHVHEYDNDYFKDLVNLLLHFLKEQGIT